MGAEFSARPPSEGAPWPGNRKRGQVRSKRKLSRKEAGTSVEGEPQRSSLMAPLTHEGRGKKEIRRQSKGRQGKTETSLRDGNRGGEQLKGRLQPRMRCSCSGASAAGRVGGSKAISPAW